MVGILGKKIGMTQLFQEDGTWVPVTVVQAGPCKVLQVKVEDAAELAEPERKAATNHGKRRGRHERARRPDGYYAVQIGFDDKSEKAATKAEKGHATLADSASKSFVREFRCEGKPDYNRGDEIRVDIFKDVKRVDVTGTTKGRGFAGTIKRWGFARQSTTHGNSKHHRKPGGIGRTYSTHHGVPKNKKMCGHFGVDRRTVQNLKVVKIDEERNLVFLQGAVPGHRSSYVILRETVKK